MCMRAPGGHIESGVGNPADGGGDMVWARNFKGSLLDDCCNWVDGSWGSKYRAEWGGSAKETCSLVSLAGSESLDGLLVEGMVRVILHRKQIGQSNGVDGM